MSFSKNCQVAAKCCKITWFAANSIIWKLTHWLLPNLVHSIGLSCGEDSDRFFFKNYQVAAIFNSHTICCILHFAASWIFLWKKSWESIQNAQQVVHTKFGSDYCNISKFIQFAAKNTILQHFASSHHFLREKPFWINSECQTSPVYQVWKWLLQYFGSYTICCKWYHFAAFCSNLMISVKETFLKQFRMSNHPSVPS